MSDPDVLIIGGGNAALCAAIESAASATRLSSVDASLSYLHRVVHRWQELYKWDATRAHR